MNLKEKMFRRIERNSIKIPNVNGDTIYLKKSQGEWRVIYPPVDLKSVEDNTNSEGKTNWNKVKWDKTALIFGSKTNAIKTALVGFIVLLLAFGMYEIVNSYNAIISHPVVNMCIENAGITIG